MSIALLTSVIEKMVPRFVSTVVCGSGNIHQVLSRKNGNTYVHLINAGGEHSDPNVLVYDDIAPAQNIEVKLTSSKRPKSITLRPGDTIIPFTYKNSIATIHLPSVKLYDILEIKF